MAPIEMPETQYGAIACASAIAAAARPLGVEVRAGLHTGEVELEGVPGEWSILEALV